MFRDLPLQDHDIERRDLDMQRTGSLGEQKDKTGKGRTDYPSSAEAGCWHWELEGL